MKHLLILLAASFIFAPFAEARHKEQRFLPNTRTYQCVEPSKPKKKLNLFGLLKRDKKPEPYRFKDLQIPKATPKKKPQVARVTFYDPTQDKWGSKVADPGTYRAKEGVTVAAHKNVPFGTTVQIPGLKGIVGDGMFEVQDRGSAVNSKKADYKYGRNAPVIDVYVSSKWKRKNLMVNVPDYLEIHIL